MSSVIEIDEKYQRGKIYKLVDRTNGNIYIGSTIKTLNQRLSHHKYVYKSEYNVVTSFDIIENGNYYIELIEPYPCNNRHDLEKRERFHIENNICVNKIIPTRTSKEWREDNKAEIALKNKELYEDNKEQIILRNKEYAKNHKEEIALKQKEWYNKNKVEILLKQKDYHEDNKEQILLRNKELIICDICSCNITRGNFARHNKSQKHINNMNNLIK